MSSLDRDTPRKIKVMLLGDADVGKTSVILNYISNVRAGTTVNTIGVDYKRKSMKVRGQEIDLEIWDTGGQDRFRALGVAYYRRADAMVLFFDVSSRETFMHVQTWAESIRANSSREAPVPVFLVGNKIDLSSERTVEREEAESAAASLGFPYHETSVASGEGISELFTSLVEFYFDREQAVFVEPSQVIVREQSQSVSRDKKKCC
jgi:small GTP-binding protein